MNQRAGATAQTPLRETLHAVARLAIEQQYGDPVYAAALDHEERRLPIGARLRRADQRFGAAAMALLQRHRAELAPALVNPETARDLLLITRALVEADAQDSRKPPPNLEARIVRALAGYLGLR